MEDGQALDCVAKFDHQRYYVSSGLSDLALLEFDEVGTFVNLFDISIYLISKKNSFLFICPKELYF